MSTIRNTLWNLIHHSEKEEPIDDITLLRAYAMSKYAAINEKSFEDVSDQFMEEYPFLSKDTQLCSYITDNSAEQFSKYNLYDFLILATPNLIGDRKKFTNILNRISSNSIERASFITSLAEVNRAMKADQLTLSQAEDQKFNYYQKLFFRETHKIPEMVFSELYESFINIPLDTEYALKMDSPSDKREIDKALNYFESIGDDKTDVEGYLINIYKNLKSFSKTHEIKHNYENWDAKKVREFNRNLQSLYNIPALNIYRSLYCGINSDQQLETTFIYDRFVSSLLSLGSDNTSNTLIIDPSPEFIYRLLNDSPVINATEYTIIFQDWRQAEFLQSALLSKDTRLDIKDGGMVRFFFEGDFKKTIDNRRIGENNEEKTENGKYDLILHFGNHYCIAEQRKWIWELLKDIEKPITVLSLMATNEAANVWHPVGDVFTSEENEKQKLEIVSVDLVPQNIHGSSKQKRKVLFTVKKNVNRELPVELNCYYLRTDKNDAEMIVRDISSPILVDQNEIENLGIGIRKYYHQITHTIKGTNSEKRNRPNKYNFTPEISIWYTVTEKVGATNPRVRAYICQEADNKKLERTQHNPIPRGLEIEGTSKIVTKYSSDEVIQWLEEIYPYSTVIEKSNIESEETNNHKKIRNIISQEIGQRYFGRDISLKTFWYIYPELEEKYGVAYESITKIAKSDIGLLKLSELTLRNTAALIDIIEPIEKKSRAYLGYLSQFLNEAIEKKHIEKNPLEEELEKEEKLNGRDLIAEIRNALGKRDFSLEENIKILEETIKELDCGHYIYIGVLIKQLTGLDSNTICGLKYGDITALNDYPDVNRFMLTHEVTNNGKEKPYKRIEDYRSMPVPQLVDFFVERIKSTIREELKLTESEIKKAYIQTSTNEITKLSITMPCSPVLLESLCADIIKRIGIEDMVITIPLENEATKEINLMLYGGDIFRSNFRSLALSEAGIMEDELMYLLGNKPTVTFYRYYCDFNNDASLLILAKKMSRIELRLWGERDTKVRRSIMKNVRRYRSNYEDINRVYASPRRYEYEITNSPDNLKIIAESRYGMTIEVLVLETENEY